MVATGVAAFVAACAGPDQGDTKVVDDPQLGKVLQWEKDDLFVLASGWQPAYQAGTEIRLHVIIQNQSALTSSPWT